MDTVKGSVSSQKGFYVGDICYVLPDEIYYGIWGNKYDFQDGVFTLTKEDLDGKYAGLTFAVARTWQGDGEYVDNKDRTYAVDAGVIGLVPLELVEKDYEGLGQAFSGAGTAEFEASAGYFEIELPSEDSIYISTEYDDFEDEDYDYEDSDDEDFYTDNEYEDQDFNY